MGDEYEEKPRERVRERERERDYRMRSFYSDNTGNVNVQMSGEAEGNKNMDRYTNKIKRVGKIKGKQNQG